MANELTLKLAQPIEKLVPAMIAFNNAELMEAVKARLVAYRGKTYDADTIGEAKADRATLNKFSQALNAERLRVKKIYTAPLEQFTAQVNEVIAVVDECTAEIDEQVKSWENDCKEAKLAQIKAYFAEVLPADLSSFITYEKIHKKDWLNASKSITAVKKEIDVAIEKIKAELSTIEALGGDTAEPKAMYFEDLSLTNTLTVYKRREADKQRIAAMEAESAKMSEAKQTVAPEPATQPQDEPEELYSIAFKVTGTKAQLNALKAFMTQNNIKFERA